MPRVRAMQARGANFTNYTVSHSLCCPSRATIMTGQYPHTSGIYTNTEPDGGYGKFKPRAGAADLWRVATARRLPDQLYGQVLNGYDPLAGNGQVGSNVPPGWSDWHVGGNGFHNFNYTLNENGREVRYGKKRTDYLTDVLARKSGRFIRSSAAAGQPFALEVSTFSHTAPSPPRRATKRPIPSSRPRGTRPSTRPMSATSQPGYAVDRS